MAATIALHGPQSTKAYAKIMRLGADDCHANVLLRDPEELAELGALAQDRQRRVQPCRLHADAHA